ncbi:MAG: histidine phosphatase family protein [Labilithrix sp.]|nr:histidine phosphatase family protein [Labilithrix sp.]MBX3219280.1 histidine phosphatase family protein [Labilithrix sp.]
MGTRTLLLVRHGQYGLEDGGRLTELGREQAQVTGRWIFEQLAGQRVDALWSSTLPRARETASIIASNVTRSKVRAIGVLREGIYSKVKGYEVPPSERLEDRARADAAFTRLFRTSRGDRLEIVVCHGNLIRYLVCRAIDVPVARWTRMNSNHCSLTRILVRDTGAVRVVSYNETAHLPAAMVT